jgi:hypothetical protein
MYRRAVFEFVRGFDPSVSPAEDYDLYLRIAGTFPVYCYEKVVAEYRHHDKNVSDDNQELALSSTLAVLQSQLKYVKRQKRFDEAYRRGVRAGQAYYGEQLASIVRTCMRKRERKRSARSLLVLLRYYPRGCLSALRSAFS